MYRWLTRALCLPAVAVGLALVPAGPAAAHPLGNFTVNTADRLVVTADGLEVTHVVDYAEIPTVQLAQARTGADTSGDKVLSEPELAAYAGRECTRLAEVLEVLPPSTGINVDLKENGLATDAVDVLGAHDGGVLISSFDAGVLAEVTVLADYPRALLVEADPEERLARAADLNCTAIHPHWDICDERFVSRAHDANLTVNAWTIRDSVGAVSARNAGVDGFITDHSDFCAK
jgi:glycerophosphoryl diester phosphodiesterase